MTQLQVDTPTNEDSVKYPATGLLPIVEALSRHAHCIEDENTSISPLPGQPPRTWDKHPL